MEICGIDPGLASGGMTLITGKPAGEQVIKTHTLRTKPGKTDRRDRQVDPQFTDAVERTRIWVPEALQVIRDWQPDVIAIESFTDQKSRAKRRKKDSDEPQFDQNRWMTTLVIGQLDLALRELGYTDEQIFYQNPAILGGLRSEIGLITKANKNQRHRAEDVLLPGDHLLRNDHVLKAWCHASWRRERLVAAAA